MFGEKSPIHTSATRNVKFTAPRGAEVEAYCTQNQSKEGVVVIQEWWGLNVSMQSIADKFATAGFKAMCPDMYQGKVAKNADEATHSMKGLSFDDAVDNVRGASKYLKAQGCQRVGAVGFCMGGALVIASTASADTGLDAGVCFYGVPDITKYKVSNIKAPMLLQFGKTDAHAGFSDEASAVKLYRAMSEAKVNVELCIYEGAGHAFMNKDRPDAYNADVAEQAFKRTVDFFHKYLASK